MNKDSQRSEKMALLRRRSEANHLVDEVTKEAKQKVNCTTFMYSPTMYSICLLAWSCISIPFDSNETSVVGVCWNPYIKCCSLYVIPMYFMTMYQWSQLQQVVKAAKFCGWFGPLKSDTHNIQHRNHFCIYTCSRMLVLLLLLYTTTTTTTVLLLLILLLLPLLRILLLLLLLLLLLILQYYYYYYFYYYY